jgi:hypothetical protein
MADEHERECFNNPLILYSEHKRVLGDAIARADEKTRLASYQGRLRGIADTLLLTVILCVIAAIAGFNFGLAYCDQPASNVCVSLYDNTGYERCQ